MSMEEMINAKRLAMKAEGRKILDKAQAENRANLNATEQAQFDQITAGLRSIDEATQQLVTEPDARDADLAAQAAAVRRSPIDLRSGSGRSVDDEMNAQLRDSFHSRSQAPIECTPTQYRSGFQPGIEQRAAISTTGQVGTGFFNSILMHLVANSAILSAGATMLQSSNGEPLKVPKSTADSSAAIVTEGGTIPEAEPTISTASLGAFKYGILLKITRELIEDESFDVAGYLAAQAGRALANAAGANFISGTGTAMPFGLLTGTTLGVTGSTAVAGAFNADNLIDLYHSVAAPYARSDSAAWLMNNASLGLVRKLKDSQNRYLFSLDAPKGSGADGSLFGRPVYTDPSMPSIGLNAKSIAFGDISRYWVRSVNGFRFEPSYDFAFDQDIVVYKAVWRTDGVLVDQTGAVKHFVGAAS